MACISLHRVPIVRLSCSFDWLRLDREKAGSAVARVARGGNRKATKRNVKFERQLDRGDRSRPTRNYSHARSRERLLRISRRAERCPLNPLKRPPRPDRRSTCSERPITRRSKFLSLKLNRSPFQVMRGDHVPRKSRVGRYAPTAATQATIRPAVVTSKWPINVIRAVASRNAVLTRNFRQLGLENQATAKMLRFGCLCELLLRLLL